MKKVVYLFLALTLLSMPISSVATGEPAKTKEVEPKATLSVAHSDSFQTQLFERAIRLSLVPIKTEPVELEPEVLTQFSVKQDVDQTEKTPEVPVETKEEKTAKQLDKHLGGKLAGKGIAFAKSASDNSVDPYLVAAIAMVETGNGKSSAVKNKNNVGGLMGSNGLKRFGSVEESIDYLSDLIRNSYIEDGLDTIPEISKRYAPIGASNDPNGLNRSWVNDVTFFYKKLQNET